MPQSGRTPLGLKISWISAADPIWEFCHRDQPVFISDCKTVWCGADTAPTCLLSSDNCSWSKQETELCRTLIHVVTGGDVFSLLLFLCESGPLLEVSPHEAASGRCCPLCFLAATTGSTNIAAGGLVPCLSHKTKLVFTDSDVIDPPACYICTLCTNQDLREPSRDDIHRWICQVPPPPPLYLGQLCFLCGSKSSTSRF